MKKNKKNVRDRVVELRKVTAAQVQDHPHNWRLHEDDQKGAMDGVLREVGYVKPIDVYIPKPDDALVKAGKLRAGVPCIMDGHLRKSRVPDDFPLSLNVTDLTEAEALKYLATCDPIAGLAGQDDEKLIELLSQIDSDDKHVQKMLADLVDMDLEDGDEDGDDVAGSGGDQFQVVIECANEDEQRALVEELTTRGLKFRALVA